MWTNSGAQFRAFLEDYNYSRPLGGAATHVWPQADKIDALPRGCSYSFIGRAETFSESLKALFPKGVIPPHDHKAEEDNCKNEMIKTFHYGPNEKKLLCQLLSVDFICFGYPLPPECM